MKCYRIGSIYHDQLELNEWIIIRGSFNKSLYLEVIKKDDLKRIYPERSENIHRLYENV